MVHRGQQRVHRRGVVGVGAGGQVVLGVGAVALAERRRAERAAAVERAAAQRADDTEGRAGP
ncbi:hypothetical protein HGA09_07205 [Cellulomonas hominis]|nr:hypothetical protein [Cellulomonas hominis]